MKGKNLYFWQKRREHKILPPLKIQHEFSKTQMHGKIHTKKWRKIKIWSDENQNLIERKKWKTDIFTKFYKNDESMISKKGVRSNTVKEIIRELSESDDEWVWDRSFCFHDDIVFVQVWLFDALFLLWSHQWDNFFLKSSTDMLLNLDLKVQSWGQLHFVVSRDIRQEDTEVKWLHHE